MEMATGYYLNLFTPRGVDVFLIFNEPNGEPTSEEVELLMRAMEQEIDSNPDADKKHLTELLTTAVALTECECIEYGFQIVIRSLPLPTVGQDEYEAEIKLDEQSINRLCNSLNAWMPPVRNVGFQPAAFFMLRAEGTIFRLFEENQKLKKMLESS